MPNHRHGDRLTWADALFLYLEREGMPLNVAGVSVFEGVISREACAHFIASKLPLIPRYYQRVVTPPFNVGLPAWEYDPEFDVRKHVHEVTLKQGTEAEFQAVCGKLLGKVMDRQMPLWDLTLVRGLKGNRTGVVARVHHCLADGIAGVGIMNVIFDANPAVPRLPKRKRHFRVPPPRDAFASLLDGWLSSFSNMVQRSLEAQSELTNIAERVVASGRDWPAGEFAKLLPELTAPTEPLHFNVTYRGPQKFAWAEIPLAEIKAIKQACGTSVNDVVLALVTSTIRRYAELHGDKIDNRLLRIMVPVNLRGSDKPDDLGNRISLVPVTIPLDVRHPRKLLAAVHERTEFLKRTHVAELVSLAGTLMGTIATPLQAMLGPFASQLPITPFNLVCTNVPGPQFPLYLLGHKMLKWYPYVPVGGEMTLNCAILSYNGAVYFGFSGCSQAAPDLGRVVSLLKASATELCRATGIKSSRPERTIAKRKSSQKPKKVAKTQVPVPFPTGPPALEPVAMASPTIPTNATTVAAVPLHS